MDFAHKDLRALFELHDARRLNADLVARIERILSDLDAAESAHDMNRPGYRLHALKGDQRGFWSVRVSRQLAYRVSLRRRRGGGCRPDRLSLRENLR